MAMFKGAKKEKSAAQIVSTETINIAVEDNEVEHFIEVFDAEQLAVKSTERIRELKNSIANYKAKHEAAVDQLAQEQLARAAIEAKHKSILQLVEQLEQVQANHESVKDGLEKKLQQALEQAKKFESIARTEYGFRKQAELRTKEILSKVERLKEIGEAERMHRKVAEIQAQKAVNRAREIMSYFFNAPFVGGADGVNSAGNCSAAGFVNSSFPEFDSLMLSRKMMF